MAKTKTSERDYIDANGNLVDRIEEATGARYTLVAIGKSWDVQCGEAGKQATMHAILGTHTKLGNEVNTVRNDPKDPGTWEDAAAAIDVHLTNTAQGIWREVGESTRAPKYDKDLLASLLGSQPGAKGDAAYYKAKLDDASYYAKVRANTPTMALYHAEIAKRGGTAATMDSVL